MLAEVRQMITCDLWEKFEELVIVDCIGVALADFLEQNVKLRKVPTSLNNLAVNQEPAIILVFQKVVIIPVSKR
jgi:hypothetical protein